MKRLSFATLNRFALTFLFINEKIIIDMDQSIIQDIKQKAIPILKKAGVTRSAVFGSYARGENTKKSDIDFLIDLPRDKSLLDFVHLKLELEKKLGKKVDLVEYEAIKPRFKPYILHDQIQIL